MEVKDRPPAAGQPAGELAAGLIEQAERLVKLEIELAKQEVRELAISNGIAAAAFAGAGLLVLLAVLVAVPVWIVTLLGHHAIAAGVWIVLYLAVAGGLALFGRSKLRLQAPRRTIDSLKETKDWVVQQTRSPRR